MDAVSEAKALSAEIYRINKENQLLIRKLWMLWTNYRYLQMQARSLIPQAGSAQTREEICTATDVHLPCKKRKIRSGGHEEQESSIPTEHCAAATDVHKLLYIKTDCDSSMINDGCQWRKYGQKMTRNNTHPRSYYRCAMGQGQGCPVKKQMQRCSHDPSLVMITYEGHHTHALTPLAVAALNAASHHLTPSTGFITLPHKHNCTSTITSSAFPTTTATANVLSGSSLSLDQAADLIITSTTTAGQSQSQSSHILKWLSLAPSPSVCIKKWSSI